LENFPEISRARGAERQVRLEEIDRCLVQESGAIPTVGQLGRINIVVDMRAAFE